MALCAVNQRDSVSLLSFPFLSHVHVFSCEMSLVSRLKCHGVAFVPGYCRSAGPRVLLLFLVAVISLPSRFSMWSSSRCIHVSTLSLICDSVYFPVSNNQISIYSQIKILKIVLFGPQMASYQGLPLQARVDLRAMVIEGVLGIPLNYSITETSTSDCLVSYQEYSLEVGTPLKRSSVFYSPSTADWQLLCGSFHFVFSFIFIIFIQ